MSEVQSRFIGMSPLACRSFIMRRISSKTSSSFQSMAKSQSAPSGTMGWSRKGQRYPLWPAAPSVGNSESWSRWVHQSNSVHSVCAPSAPLKGERIIIFSMSKLSAARTPCFLRL